MTSSRTRLDPNLNSISTKSSEETQSKQRISIPKSDSVHEIVSKQCIKDTSSNIYFKKVQDAIEMLKSCVPNEQ